MMKEVLLKIDIQNTHTNTIHTCTIVKIIVSKFFLCSSNSGIEGGNDHLLLFGVYCNICESARIWQCNIVSQ